MAVFCKHFLLFEPNFHLIFWLKNRAIFWCFFARKLGVYIYAFRNAYFRFRFGCFSLANC